MKNISVVYKATEVVASDNTTNTYTGLTSNTFKKRFYKHRISFEKKNYQNPTTLSTHVWDLKNKNKNFDMKRTVID